MNWKWVTRSPQAKDVPPQTCHPPFIIDTAAKESKWSSMAQTGFIDVSFGSHAEINCLHRDRLAHCVQWGGFRVAWTVSRLVVQGVSPAWCRRDACITISAN